MSLHWNSLRTWNGSQQTAFEELCCQLARYEMQDPDATFIRKGTPDAGVECFWRLRNGTELGWQAKFFLNSPTAKQWSDIDKSVSTALDKHPKLAQYTVCLPIDRPDSRVVDTTSFLKKWQDRVIKWEKMARKKNLVVTFLYWGDHEIAERLSKAEHRGRHRFWFNEQQFDEIWFRQRLAVSIANAGERYTPDLNIDLSISRNFHAIGRTPTYFEGWIDLYKNLRNSLSTLNSSLQSKTVQYDGYLQLKDSLQHLVLAFESAVLDPERYPWHNPSRKLDLAAWIEKAALRRKPTRPAFKLPS